MRVCGERDRVNSEARARALSTPCKRLLGKSENNDANLDSGFNRSLDYCSVIRKGNHLGGSSKRHHHHHLMLEDIGNMFE